jgi:hypothetical protein
LPTAQADETLSLVDKCSDLGPRPLLIDKEIV